MLSSTVSSKIIKTMADKEGFYFDETLTGFKWLGNRAITLIQQGYYVIFAFEEAIGFMVGTTTFDKDGVSAMAAFYEMATVYYSQNKTVTQHLESIYQKYGYHVTNNRYYICHDQAVILKIFQRLRNFESKSDTYPPFVITKSGKKYNVTHVRDLTTGYDDSKPDKKAILPTSSSSQMITFNFDNGAICTLRTSGTEPKIKYYTELIGTQSKQYITNELAEMLAAIIEHFLQPTENALINPPD